MSRMFLDDAFIAKNRNGQPMKDSVNIILCIWFALLYCQYDEASSAELFYGMTF